MIDYQWRKARASDGAGNCVEVRQDHQAIRDTKNTDQSFSIPRTAFKVFVTAVTVGALAFGGIMVATAAPAGSSSIAGQCRC